VLIEVLLKELLKRNKDKTVTKSFEKYTEPGLIF